VGDEREQAPAHGGGQAQEGEPDLLRRREEGTRHVQVTSTRNNTWLMINLMKIKIQPIF
jgi:hypothetical protein